MYCVCVVLVRMRVRTQEDCMGVGCSHEDCSFRGCPVWGVKAIRGGRKIRDKGKDSMDLLVFVCLALCTYVA